MCAEALIAIIGRGHSGTRMLSHTLYASGVFMGNCLNPSGDKIPADAMYEAARVMGKYVRWKGGLDWDFAALSEMPIDREFTRLVERFLSDVLASKARQKGWKLPETTLVYPWIVRMFPQVKYIYLIRDPRDSIIGAHLTDDLATFGVEYPPTEDERERRAISWKYQYELVKATPQPRHFVTVRFEDFILRQEETLGRLEAFLGIPLARIIVRRGTIGRWKTDEGRHDFEFFGEAMAESGYAD